MHRQTLSAWPGVLEHYRSHMTWLPEGTPIVTLQEGNTRADSCAAFGRGGWRRLRALS